MIHRLISLTLVLYGQFAYSSGQKSSRGALLASQELQQLVRDVAEISGRFEAVSEEERVVTQAARSDMLTWEAELEHLSRAKYPFKNDDLILLYRLKLQALAFRIWLEMRYLVAEANLILDRLTPTVADWRRDFAEMRAIYDSEHLKCEAIRPEAETILQTGEIVLARIQLASVDDRAVVETRMHIHTLRDAIATKSIPEIAMAALQVKVGNLLSLIGLDTDPHWARSARELTVFSKSLKGYIERVTQLQAIFDRGYAQLEGESDNADRILSQVEDILQNADSLVPVLVSPELLNRAGLLSRHTDFLRHMLRTDRHKVMKASCAISVKFDSIFLSIGKDMMHVISEALRIDDLMKPTPNEVTRSLSMPTLLTAKLQAIYDREEALADTVISELPHLMETGRSLLRSYEGDAEQSANISESLQFIEDMTAQPQTVQPKIIKALMMVKAESQFAKLQLLFDFPDLQKKGDRQYGC